MNANPKLLTGIEALTKPNFHELNEHDGRNDRLLHAVLCGYAKHHLGNEDIGWEKLGEILHDVICNEIGDDNYCAWADKIKEESPWKKVVFTFPGPETPPVNSIQIENSGFMGRIGKRGGRDYEGPEWVSRDHVLLVPCQRTCCPVNSSKHCSMPSKIAIDAAGECMTGMEFKEKPAVLPPKGFCRICGGKIEPNPRGPMYYPPWVHVGEKMFHTAEHR